MKASNFNFFFPYEQDNEKMIAYNAFSNSLALLDMDKYGMLTAFDEHGTAIDDEEFVKQLKSTGFLVEDEISEIELIRLKMLRSRFSTRSMGLTIAPTADCNFRCPYCYEKGVIKPQYMTPETEEAIVKLVESRAKSIETLRVSWYGGEPLMAAGVVESLSKRFIEICEEHKITYNASMVTNGYFLNRENIEMLNSLKVTSVQVTIDGNREMHDSMRFLADGGGTFDTIMDNLSENKDIIPMIDLRMNVNKNNAPHIKEVQDMVKCRGLSDKVKPYLGKMTKDNEEYDGSVCFSASDFADEYLSRYYEVENDDYMDYYPKKKANYCTADSEAGLVIDSEGRVYKCWKDIGKNDRCIGTVKQSKNYDFYRNERLYLNYLLYDPTQDDLCKHCKVLPICMGSCPADRVVNATDKCSMYKFNLDGIMNLVARKLMMKKDTSKVR